MEVKPTVPLTSPAPASPAKSRKAAVPGSTATSTPPPQHASEIVKPLATKPQLTAPTPWSKYLLIGILGLLLGLVLGILALKFL